jgi:DNA recombination protein RmuC
MSDFQVTILLAAFIIVLLLFVLARLRRTGGPNETLIRLEGVRQDIEKLERTIRDEILRVGEALINSTQSGRKETQDTLRNSADSLQARLAENASLQRNQLDSFAGQLSTLAQSLEQKVEGVRDAVERRLGAIQEDNSRQLERMRVTVDEKLHATLEQRLGESFRQVSERLEQVQQGLGEMKTLATGVGDLKKVLTNVKSRGVWGEIQLGALLEQILTRDQYGVNVATKEGSNERVEFAIRLPGREDHDAGPVWLPIDAKFPQDDYQRLLEAQDQANLPAIDQAGKDLENRVKLEARTIHEKYVNPPQTTDFAIMFLPTEGLYAEILRRPGLAEMLQREFKILVTGPTTLAALLNSLQMGFRTLAIEKRSSEVWSLLAAVKTEFGKFGDVLDKTQKKLQEASNTIESAASRSRQIERKLRQVQELPAAEAARQLEERTAESEDTDEKPE